MNPVDIASLLPEQDGATYQKIKEEHPYHILSKYADVIGYKYSGKLSGVVTESVDANNQNLISCAFYILAEIGTGYSYRLLELLPSSGDNYPITVTIFEKTPQKFAEANTPLQLEEALQAVLKTGFVQSLILNLLAQIDIYRESRAG